MLLLHALLKVCLYLLIVNAPQAAEGRYAIVPRQNSPSPTERQPPASAPNPTASAASKKGTQDASHTAAASKSALGTSTAASDASKIASSTTGPSPSHGNPSSTSSVDPAVLTATPIANNTLVVPDNAPQDKSGELPIKPTITPALSVAGAILMLTGIFYTLIGIKTKWLHIFFSTAYLTSLAVTVLVIYVMHPPVSNAIQGAYFVAACATGLLFGGGSVIFADVTEGLGCLLGGFSLSMWFLVLVPGGLIKSTAGKVIFIACFTLGSFGFYLSHWTRAYGLIGATSFAGATVVVLGIDCFSRAGLKEFWLYIWDLNDNIFPLRYGGPYPVTRGIRVEIAAIVIGFLLGVMSQMKIWKIIKRRREARDAENLRQEKLQDQAEQNLGRTIEEGNLRDRSVWEAAYNGRNGTDRHVDSGIGTEVPSVDKSSLSIMRASGVTGRGSIELDELEHGKKLTEGDLRSGGKGKGRTTVTVRVASDDDVIHTSPTAASAIDEADQVSPLSETQSVQREDSPPCFGKGKAKTAKASGPEVVPLPFKVPDADTDDDKGSSNAASVASDHFPGRVLKKLSGASLKRTSSKRSQRSYIATSTSEEALMIAQNNDEDRASSVAANVDEISDGKISEADTTMLAVLPSPAPEAKDLLKYSPPMEPHLVDRPGHEVSEMSLSQASSHSTSGQDHGAPEGHSAKVEDAANGTSPVGNPSPGSELPLSEAQEQSGLEKLGTDIESAAAPTPVKPAMHERLADLEGTSKVVMAYRTNEWAKHLDSAEKPSIDDLRAKQLNDSTPAPEKVAAVDVEALQQTPMTAKPAPAASLPKLNTSTSPIYTRNNSSTPSKSQDSLPQSPAQRRTSSHSLDCTSSQTSLDSLPSRRAKRTSQPVRQSSSQTAHRSNYRSSSTPLVDSPINEDTPTTVFPQRSNPPTLPTTNTLMSHRQSMLQSRPSSTSLTYVPTSLSRVPSDDALDDGDNVPLSHRRRSLKSQQPQALNRTPSSGYASSAYPFPVTPQPNPSPSPSTNKNNNNNSLAHWRASLTSSSPAQHARLEARHSDLLLQKRRSESNARQSEQAKLHRENSFDAKWRSSGAGMEERHREAMRKLQSKVGEGP
ncbi:MAG: hypothetical protein Q9181_006461 [Wetmoreana brouardii]